MPSWSMSTPVTRTSALPSPLTSKAMVAVGPSKAGCCATTFPLPTWDLAERDRGDMSWGEVLCQRREWLSTAGGGPCKTSGMPSRSRSTPVTTMSAIPSPSTSTATVAIGSSLSGGSGFGGSGFGGSGFGGMGARCRGEMANPAPLASSGLLQYRPSDTGWHDRDGARGLCLVRAVASTSAPPLPSKGTATVAIGGVAAGGALGASWAGDAGAKRT